MILMMLAAAAFGAEDPLSPQTVSEGQTSMARVSDLSAIVVNPAMMSLSSDYEGYAFGETNSGDAWRWGVAALDSFTSRAIALGVSYSGEAYEPPLTDADLPGWSASGQDVSNKKRHNDLTFALSTPFAQRRLSIGANLDWSIYDHDRQGQGAEVDLGAGMGWRASQYTLVGVAVRNILPGEATLNRTFGVGAGASHRTEFFDAASDVEWVPQTNAIATRFGLAGGSDNARLHAGWATADWRASGSHLSTGLTLQNTNVSIGYGVAFPLGDAKALGITHNLGIRLKLKVPGVSQPMR